MNINFTLVLQIISFLILLGSLGKFLYRPLMKYLEERAKEANDILDSARQAEEKAKEYADRTQQALDAAKYEALKIKDETRRLADKERLDTISQAREEAHRLIEEAKKQVKKEEQDATKRVKTKIGDLSLEIAAKILGREISEVDHKQLIDNSIEEIERGSR